MKHRTPFVKLTTFLLDLLFPKQCLGCQKDDAYLCKECSESIPINKKLTCYNCGKITPGGECCPACKNRRPSPLAGLLLASEAENALLHQIIYKFKYNFIKELSQPLGKILIKFLETIPQFKKQNILLISVPLSRRRLHWRGFNQAQLLAAEVQRHFSFPIGENILKRSRHTRPQMEIKDAQSRRQAIKGAFKSILPYSETLKDKIIILVDDVATTTATLEECAKALRPLKPRKIFGLVLCRG